MTSSIKDQRTIDELTKERERLKHELIEANECLERQEKQIKDIALYRDDLLAENKKLKEDLDHMTSLNTTNFNEVNLQISKVQQLREEITSLLEKNHLLSATISKLEVQIHELKEDDIGNLSLNAKLLDENKLLKNLNTTLIETVQSLNFVIKKL